LKYTRESAGSANIAEFAAVAGPEPLKPLVIIWKRSHCVPMYPERLAGRYCKPQIPNPKFQIPKKTKLDVRSGKGTNAG
jgi:hypothetical protein